MYLTLRLFFFLPSKVQERCRIVGLPAPGTLVSFPIRNWKTFFVMSNSRASWLAGMVPEWIWIEMVLLKAQAGLFRAITKNERPEFQVAAVLRAHYID